MTLFLAFYAAIIFAALLTIVIILATAGRGTNRSRAAGRHPGYHVNAARRGSNPLEQPAVGNLSGGAR